jgi:hypothetical protein
MWTKVFFCMQPEVDLYENRGGFARGSRWFWICMHPKAVQTVHIRDKFWELCQEGHSESSSKIYRVYTQKT